MVEYRCLRCGATVGGSQPAASTAHGPAAPEPDVLPAPPSDPPAATPGPASNGSVAEGNGRDDDQRAASALAALRELGELHAAGILTDGEFAAKKAELLRRV